MTDSAISIFPSRSFDDLRQYLKFGYQIHQPFLFLPLLMPGIRLNVTNRNVIVRKAGAPIAEVFMKQVFSVVTVAACCGLAFAHITNAEVVYHPFAYQPTPVFGCPCIDFDGDGATELSFESYGIGNESVVVFYLSTYGSANTEVLQQDGRVQPLNWGNPISATSSPGPWSGTGFGSVVWVQAFNTGTPIIIIPPGGGLVTNAPPPSPPGQGVGMPGYGNFLGARFPLTDGWHYGWVRFGVPDGSSFFLPALLDYAYESRPDTAILAGAGIDSDQDGVWDLLDQCPDTPAGATVDGHGCSIEQLCPCDGPWKNHGEYVKCVEGVASVFLQEGRITEAQRRGIVEGAASSGCGKQPPPAHHSGIRGQTSIYICPAAYPGEVCTVPFQTTLKVFSQSGTLVTETRTDSSGHFQANLPPGNYQVVPWVPSPPPWTDPNSPPSAFVPYPYAAPVSVTVAPRQFVELSIVYDAGIY
jgi:hypothetical protein